MNDSDVLTLMPKWILATAAACVIMATIWVVAFLRGRAPSSESEVAAAHDGGTRAPSVVRRGPAHAAD